MKAFSCACLVAVALVLAPMRLVADQNTRFRHLMSIYVDDTGASLNLPEGVACGANGQIVVGDTGNDRLLGTARNQFRARPTLLADLRRFMVEHFAFGDFVFRMPDGSEVARASDLKDLEEISIEDLIKEMGKGK